MSLCYLSQTKPTLLPLCLPPGDREAGDDHDRLRSGEVREGGEPSLSHFSRTLPLPQTQRGGLSPEARPSDRPVRCMSCPHRLLRESGREEGPVAVAPASQLLTLAVPPRTTRLSLIPVTWSCLPPLQTLNQASANFLCKGPGANILAEAMGFLLQEHSCAVVRQRRP